MKEAGVATAGAVVWRRLLLWGDKPTIDAEGASIVATPPTSGVTTALGIKATSRKYPAGTQEAQGGA